MFEARLAGQSFGEEDLVASFRAAWVSEGFLSREHEERRLAAGEAALRRFAVEQAATPWMPTAVEQEFQFTVGRNRVQGRYDLVIERDGELTIVDFKTGDVRDQAAADRRAAESFQLDIYALAQLVTAGRLPDRVELRFLESGLVGSRHPTQGETEATEERIRVVASAIRRREFPARPTWMACGLCPFREICPHTSRSLQGTGEPSE
jgi:DNA helicase-2/ATP-dependent DNA helicase PcrA